MKSPLKSKNGKIQKRGERRKIRGEEGRSIHLLYDLVHHPPLAQSHSRHPRSHAFRLASSQIALVPYTCCRICHLDSSPCMTCALQWAAAFSWHRASSCARARCSGPGVGVGIACARGVRRAVFAHRTSRSPKECVQPRCARVRLAPASASASAASASKRTVTISVSSNQKATLRASTMVFDWWQGRARQCAVLGNGSLF